MHIATLNDKSLAPGSKILFENDGLIINGIGKIDINTLYTLDENKALSWEMGYQEKIYALYDMEPPLVDFLIPLNEEYLDPEELEKKRLEEKMKKKKEPKEEKPVNRMVLWGAVVSVLLLFVAGGGILAYNSFFHKNKNVQPYQSSPISNSISTEETSTTSVEETTAVETESKETTETTKQDLKKTTPSSDNPIVKKYNFNSDTAIKTVNSYYTALKNKDYAKAYNLTTPSISIKKEELAPKEIGSTVESLSKISKNSWISNQKKVEYKATIKSDPITKKELGIAPFKVTANGREYFINDLSNVKLSTTFNKNMPNKIILCWDKFTNKYYVIDLSAIIKIKSIEKTFVKKTAKLTVEVQSNNCYITYGGANLLYQYVDNGAKNNVAIIYNAKKAKVSASNKKSYKVGGIWKGSESWTKPQNLEKNLITLSNDDYFKSSKNGSYSIQLNITQNNKIVVPKIDISF